MDIKPTLIKMIAAVLTVAIIYGCNHILCSRNQLSFSGGSTAINPDKDSIQVGDTLWFNSSIPSKLKYKFVGNSDSGVYDLSGASNVETDIHLNALKGYSTQFGAIDSFSFISAEGKIENNPYDLNAAKTVSYSEENGNFILSFGIVAQKKGIYCLITVDIFQATKNCDDISISILENNIDPHLHYLQDIYYGGQQIDPVDQTHSYCFKVY